MAAVAAMRAAQRKKEQVRQEAEANKREREKARAHDHHGTSGSLDAEGFVNELMEDTTKLDLNEGESAGARAHLVHVGAVRRVDESELQREKEGGGGGGGGAGGGGRGRG